jgi:ribonuclease T1
VASSGRTSGGLASALVVLLAIGAWWLQSSNDDDGPAAPTSSASSSSSAAQQRPSTPQPDAEIDDTSGLPLVDLADLPPEAAAVVTLIDQGGPFAYDKDGSTFGNYEGLLPDRPGGYYREYTVETPGSYDRGARRIIGGADGELYWTEDHYESFEVIRR